MEQQLSHTAQDAYGDSRIAARAAIDAFESGRVVLGFEFAKVALRAHKFADRQANVATAGNLSMADILTTKRPAADPAESTSAWFPPPPPPPAAVPHVRPDVPSYDDVETTSAYPLPMDTMHPAPRVDETARLDSEHARSVRVVHPTSRCSATVALEGFASECHAAVVWSADRGWTHIDGRHDTHPAEVGP